MKLTMQKITRTKPPAHAELERSAAQAHRNGLTWPQWWALHKEEVRQAEPFSMDRFRLLRKRLLHLVLCGDGTETRPEPEWAREVDKHGAG